MNLYGYEFYRESDLAHHGIKGQHWGQRRFQLLDGSLTPLGKRRLGFGGSKISSRSNSSSKLSSNVSSKIPHAKENMVSSKLVKDITADLKERPNLYDPKSVAESNSEFRLTLAEFSGIDGSKFTDDEVKYMRSQYLKGIKENEIMKDLYKEIDIHTERNPQLHPETFADSPKEFRGMLGEFLGDKGDDLSDEQVAKLYKEYKKHYEGQKEAEEKFYNSTSKTSDKKNLLSANSSSKKSNTNAKNSNSVASKKVNNVAKASAKKPEVTKSSVASKLPSSKSNVLSLKIKNVKDIKIPPAAFSIINKVKQLPLSTFKKKK